MTRRIEFHVAAQSELEEGIDFYESREAALGERFLVETQRIISLIADYPELGAPIWRTRRRVLLNRFPHAIIYRVLRDGSISGSGHNAH